MNRDKVKLLLSYFYIFCFMLAQVWLISKFEISQDFIFIFALFTLSHIGISIRFDDNRKETHKYFMEMAKLVEQSNDNAIYWKETYEKEKNRFKSLRGMYITKSKGHLN